MAALQKQGRERERLAIMLISGRPKALACGCWDFMCGAVWVRESPDVFTARSEIKVLGTRKQRSVTEKLAAILIPVGLQSVSDAVFGLCLPGGAAESETKGPQIKTKPTVVSRLVLRIDDANVECKRRTHRELRLHRIRRRSRHQRRLFELL